MTASTTKSRKQKHSIKVGNGCIYPKRGIYYFRVTLGPQKRPAVSLRTRDKEEAAVAMSQAQQRLD